MPAGFLDTTDMSDIKREMRRKKRIIVRWHMYTILSLNPTLLKYRFRNAVKPWKYNLDMINRLNPTLYWPTAEDNDDKKEGVNIKKSQKEDADLLSVQQVLDGDTTTNHNNFFVSEEKVDVRYRTTGTVLEVIYSLKDSAAARKSAGSQNVPVGHKDSQNVMQYFHDVGTIDGSDGTATSGIVENIELLNYRRLDSSSHVAGIIEDGTPAENEEDHVESDEPVVNKDNTYDEGVYKLVCDKTVTSIKEREENLSADKQVGEAGKLTKQDAKTLVENGDGSLSAGDHQVDIGELIVYINTEDKRDDIIGKNGTYDAITIDLGMSNEAFYV